MWKLYVLQLGVLSLIFQENKSNLVELPTDISDVFVGERVFLLNILLMINEPLYFLVLLILI